MNFRNLLQTMLIALVAMTFCSSSTFGQAKSRDKARKIVVMVKSDFGQGRGLSGAGFITGIRSGSIYIATANHVVRQGNASSLINDVTFCKNFEETADGIVCDQEYAVKAELLGQYEADSLDLALLRVPGSQVSFGTDDIPFNVLGKTGKLKEGAGLHAMGQPSNIDWFHNVDPHAFRQSSGYDLQFEGTIQDGNSGGALFTTKWQLVGMVKSESDESTSLATNIDAILSKVREWGYPVDLTLAPWRPSTGLVIGSAAAVGGGTAALFLLGGSDEPGIPLPEGAPSQ